MRRAQWEQVVRHRAVPPRLAIAELAEEPLQERKLYWSFAKAYRPPRPTLSDAVARARNLDGHPTDIRTFAGRFTTRA